MSDPATICPLCGRALGRMFASAHDWLMRCDGCGLGLADPQPTDAELAAIYADDYYAQFGYAPGADAALACTKRATYGRMLRFAERRVAFRSADRSLLDVGCGLGYSLAAAEARGWRATGLEPHARGGAGASAGRVVRADLDSFATDERFDLVSLIDVIEHVRDPVAALRRAGELLAPGGAVLAATNDLSSRSARRLGPRWVHFHRAHLWYFDRATLARAAERAGLRVVAAARAWRIYNMEYVCGVLAGGSNWPTVRRIARWALRWVPRPLRLMRWPPLPEGIVIVAVKDGQGSSHSPEARG